MFQNRRIEIYRLSDDTTSANDLTEATKVADGGQQ
jgi:hypothetical protein